MTPDMITMIAVGIALGGLMALMFQMMNKRMDSLEQRVISMEQRMVQRFDAFEARFSALEQRQARLEGIMEGIRDMLSRIPLVN
jgi:flagellar capping protein FliD